MSLKAIAAKQSKVVSIQQKLERALSCLAPAELDFEAGSCKEHVL